MEKQLSMFQTTPHWTVLLEKKNEDDIKDAGFNTLLCKENPYNPDYIIAEVEAEGDVPASADEVLELIDALAVHEEYTTGVLIREEDLDEIADNIYSWEGSGTELVSDMLTQIEKLSALLMHIHEKTNSTPMIDEIGLAIDKDSLPIPLEQNIDELFLNEIYGVVVNDVRHTIWWSNIIDGKGFTLIILQDEDTPYEFEEDDTPLYPLANRGSEDNEYMRDYYRELWGDYYDY